MIPSTWPPERASGEKRILGKVFAAGQTAPKDLADVVSLLEPIGQVSWIRWNNDTQRNDLSAYVKAGCSMDALVNAFTASPRAFSDYPKLSQSFFRGAMPPTLRSNIAQLMRNPSWEVNVPDEGALRMLGYALATPYFGAIKSSLGTIFLAQVDWRRSPGSAAGPACWPLCRITVWPPPMTTGRWSLSSWRVATTATTP